MQENKERFKQELINDMYYNVCDVVEISDDAISDLLNLIRNWVDENYAK